MLSALRTNRYLLRPAGTLLQVLERSCLHGPRTLNRQLQFTLDLLILVIAFELAYLLRFDFDVPKHELLAGLTQLPYVVLIQFTAMTLAGVYSFIWRYIGMAEVTSFLNAAWWSAAPLLTLRLTLSDEFSDWRVPLSVIVIDTLLAFGGVLAIRVLRRAAYEHSMKLPRALPVASGHRRPVLLIGAGRAGILTAREIQGRGKTDLEIKGFVDDDPEKLRTVIQGVKVLGTTTDLPRLVRELRIDHVVISIATASRRELKRITDICERVPVKARITPGLYELLRGNVSFSRIRDVQIEDLLGRPPVTLDDDEMRRFLADKCVMVTGAGGSIGSELVRQVARFGPSRLLLVERAECALFTIDSELRDTCPRLPRVALVADIGDEPRMRTIFAAHRPHVILHAAAHKHVPMMEGNLTEAVKNNVLATRLLGDLADEFEVEVFVLISTDKAVRPTSIMGASKRVAELTIQDLQRHSRTRYVAVRFGNVIGSAGSVIPIFREQIRKGGPVTVTHRDMMRYFMTIPEASQLVLQAGAIGEGGEIFVLDMGEPVRILDLAKETITLSGLKPFEDVDIVFTGLRPGEKLFEELQLTEERLTKTRHSKIFIGKIAAAPSAVVQDALERLTILSRTGAEDELRDFLNELLPEARLKGPGVMTPEISPEMVSPQAIVGGV
jgi:FlaA1/EpsC-like NDP-sugar epimerase